MQKYIVQNFSIDQSNLGLKNLLKGPGRFYLELVGPAKACLGQGLRVEGQGQISQRSRCCCQRTLPEAGPRHAPHG